MTVPSTARRAGPYTGNGSTTTFSFSFKTFAAGDLQVTRMDTLGIETTLVLNSDYSVSLNVDQDASPGGTITYPITGSPLPAGQKLTIVGDLEYEQTTDLLGGGAFNARVIEDTFDRATIQIQQLEERLDRAAVLPVSVSGVSATLPDPEASKVLGWNVTETGLVNIDASSLASVTASAYVVVDKFTGDGSTTQFVCSQLPGSTNAAEVTIAGVMQNPAVDYTVSGARVVFTAPPPNGAVIIVRFLVAASQSSGAAFTTERHIATSGQSVFTLANAYAPGADTISVFINGVLMTSVIDYAETSANVVTFVTGLSLNDEVVFHIWRTTVLSTADSANVSYTPAGSGAVQRTVQSKLRDVVSVKDFGAVGDNITDDTPAFQRAIDYANSVWVGGSQLGGGVTVYIPAGRYKLGALIYKNGVNLQGEGKMHTQLRVYGNNTTLIAASSNTSTMTSASNLFYGSWKDFAILSWDGAGGSTPTGQVGWDAIGFSRWYCENIYFGWGAGFVGIRMTNAILAGSGGPSNWYNTFVGCICEKHYVGAGGVGLLLGDTSSTKEQITTWNWIGGAIRGSGDGTGTGLNLQSGTGCTFYGVCFEAIQNAVLLGSAAGTRFANSVDFIGCYWEGNTVNWNVYAGCTNNGFIGGFVTGGTGTDNGSYTRFSMSGQTKAHIQGSTASDYWQVNILNGGVNRPKIVGSLAGIDLVDGANNVNLINIAASSSVWNFINAYAANLTQPLWESGTGGFSPGDDNVKVLGRSSYRWSTVYAVTPTISTSDAREKQQVRDLSVAEQAVAVKLKSMVRAFKFNDAVEKKGDGARVHFGVIAQDVKAAFESESLVAEDYAILCYDEWEAEPEMTAPVLDDNGNETGEVTVIRTAKPAGNRYGVRYEELLAFIVAAL